MNSRLYLTGTLLSLGITTFCQGPDSVIDRVTQFPTRFLSKIRNKTDDLDKTLTRQTEKYLEHLAKKERKIQQKLMKKDSLAASQLFAGSQEKYQELENKIRNAGAAESHALSGEYLPYLDSLKGTLSFLQKNENLFANGVHLDNNIAGSLASFNQLQSNLQSAEQIKEYIRQRKEQMRAVLNQYAASLGLKKYMDDFNREVYYYSAQVKEYKEMLNDPDRLERKALELVNKLPAFQQFMKNNSQLAGLFNIPGNYGTTQGLEGLQTRDQVQQMIQSVVSSGGSGGMSALQSNLESAHQQLDQFKDKLGALGGGSGDIDMPNFKPNQQKIKPFSKRLELGTNLQTTRTNYFFPTTTDIGLSLGYKLNKALTAGIGGSYKIGWGSGINHISVTSEGASIRSFFDLRLKKQFYASGGLEYNYQQPFTNFQQIRSLSAWQQSGLIGVSKMVSLSGKVIKKTKVQLLWDFLSYYQIPRTQPVKFRVGYNF